MYLIIIILMVCVEGKGGRVPIDLIHSFIHNLCKRREKEAASKQSVIRYM